ncbi:phage tail protein [Clostridium butyricum]|uniref:phage tail protein n=4 Tax=Clostridium butyricum TaxID=1492 RepID=UPI0022E4E856|nr:phage tail protein [Clostridium butyricum]
MAIFNNMSITNKGQILYAKAQAGTKLNFTKIMVGSGQIENRNPATLLALLEPKFSIGIQSITPNTELKTATISATINNSEVTEAVYICEIGLYAEDPDDGEILYAYGSAGTYGDYYAPASQGAYSWNYQINAAIGNAANVTIELSNLSYDYAVINSNTTFTVIGGGNQKEINKSIDNKISELTKKSNDLTSDSYPIVEATGTNAYIGASARIKVVGKGIRCTLFVGTASNGNCSLNLNNSGAVAIKDSNGNVVTNMKANIPYNLCHNGSDFILQGKGGGGNLIPKYLLAGYYGEGDNGRVDGTMVNRGAPTSNLNCGGVVNLQEGYYSGGQIIANSLASQTGGATADDTKVLNGYTYWRDGILRTGNATVQSMGGANFRSGSLNAPVENTINGSSITYQKVSINLSQCNFDIKVLVLTFRSYTNTSSGEETWQTAVYDLYNNKFTSGDWMVSYGSTSSSNNYRSGVNTTNITSFDKSNVLVVSRGEHESDIMNKDDQTNFGTTSRPYWKPNTIPVRWYAFG